MRSTEKATYDPAEVTRGLLDASDMLDQLQAMCVARRKSLEDAGFSPTIAEQMAAALWIGSFTGGSNS